MTPKLEKIPEYADLMTIDEWKSSVACGGFIPYDGDGHWATADKMDDSSDVWVGEEPKWATHVAWFNR